jgi:hypothetical protein
MPDPAIATAADYADAMLVARRAKSGIVLLLLVCLLLQLGLFFTARYTEILLGPRGSTPPTPAGAAVENAANTVAAATTTQPATAFAWPDLLHYLLGVSVFLGIALSVLLAFVLLLIVTIMLVGRLIGVGRVTSAYVWCLLLIVLMFPWQALFQDQTFTSRAFIWPGVMYTWDELRAFARFETGDLANAILKWARFVGFPVLAIVILMVIQVRSNRGLRQALGEDDLTNLASTPAL